MNPRKATISLLYNGTDATVQASPYLQSFTYTDVASGSSDTISVVLNDRDRKWINGWFPEKGDTLKPTIRTENWTAQGAVRTFACGSFTLDDFSIAGNPIKVSLNALALPADTGFKSTERTYTYEDATIQEIAQEIADRAGVALYYDADTISIELIEQNGTDDCSFLNDLVTKYGLALKIYNDKLVVFDEADYESKDPVATLTEADFDPGWSWNTTMTEKYTGVYYEYTNTDKNLTFTVEAGESGDTERILECNEAASNLTEATILALAAVNSANRGTTTMSITMMANPAIIATSCVQIKGLGKLSGKYYVEQVDHSLGGTSGYRMSLSLRLVEDLITSASSYSTTVEG